MAVRKIEYTVTADGISPSTIQKGGVQGEHKATEVVFNLEISLYNELQRLKNQGNRIVYRIDKYNGEGSVDRSDTTELSSQSVNYLVEEKVTRFGGLIKIVLVITAISNDSTEAELYTLTAKLQLQNLPDGRTQNGEDYKSMSTLAEVVKKNTKIAEESKNVAVEAKEQTIAAKVALQSGTEWIFDGGGASSEVDIEYVVDSELNAASENPVKNKVIYKAIGEVEKNLTQISTRESGVPENTAGTFITPIWDCKINGDEKKECYTAFNYNIKEFTRYSLHDDKTVDVAYLGKICFPTGFFDSIPYVNISLGQDEQSGIGFGGAWFTVTRIKPATDHTNDVFLITFANVKTNSDNITEINSGNGYVKYALNNGCYIPCHISVEAKTVPVQSLDNAPLEPIIIADQESNGNGGS